MTMRLDLRKRPALFLPGRAGLERTVLAAQPYGCADCGRWFQFARQLVEHRCEACDD